jgi:hypothetical protein
MLIRLFQQRPRYWFSVRNRHNIWLSRTGKLKQPDKHKLTSTQPTWHSTEKQSLPAGIRIGSTFLRVAFSVKPASQTP